MAKKKGGEAEAPAPDEQTGSGEKITKAEAVRRAIADGVDKPQDAVDYIQKQFGIQMTAQHFSSYKSQLKAKEGKAPGKRGRKARTRHESNGIVSSSSGLPAGFSVEKSPAALARQVRELVSAYGVAQVAEMVTVFSDT